MQYMMDRALRERIIGAIVLVVFAILVVPVFLDGPSDDTEIISESVTLPGQNDQDRKQQTIVLERDRSEPVPSARGTTSAASSREAETSQQAAAVVARPKPAADAPVAEKKAAEKEASVAATENSPAEEVPVAAETISSTGMWAVQLGSFSSAENAERLAADLRKQGYAAFLSQLQTASGALHRVRIGPQKDRDSAEAVAKQLKSGGHNGQVVPHP